MYRCKIYAYRFGTHETLDGQTGQCRTIQARIEDGIEDDGCAYVEEIRRIRESIVQ